MILNDAHGRYALGPHLEILEDPGRRLRIEHVTAVPHEQRFESVLRPVPSRGFSSAAYWLRFALHNRSREQNQWLLELEYPLMDRVELYISSAGKPWDTRVTGDLWPHSHREVDDNNFIFRLDLAPGSETTCYLRVVSENSIVLPLTVWEPVSFAVKAGRQHYPMGFYAGIMAVMVLYNLFLLFALRDRAYLYYILYIIGFVGFLLSMQGYGYRFLWPNSPWCAARTIPLFVAFSMFFAFLFSIHFLATRVHTPHRHRLLTVLAILTAVLFFGSLGLPYQISLKLGTILVVSFVVTVLSTAISCWRQGFRPARFFIIAWIVFLVGASLFALKVWGILPANFITVYSVQIGSALEVTLLSLALADRINVIRDERAKAQAEAIENLKKADDLKTRFLATVSHELRTPLNSIIGFSEVLKRRLETQIDDRMLEFLRRINKSGHNLLAIINDILEYSELSFRDVTLRTEAVDLAALVDGVLRELRPFAETRCNLLIDNLDPGLPQVEADPDRVQQIIHKLVTNAIKFTEHGVVEVSAGPVSAENSSPSSRDRLAISVSDTGTGIPEDKLDLVFRPFEQADNSESREHGGAGLGLAITERLVDLHAGTITVDSELGNGSRFTFTLVVAAGAERS